MALPTRAIDGGGIATGPLQTKALRVLESPTASATMGTATLAAGTVTVNTTAVTANSRIFLTGQVAGVTGALRVNARSAGVSFTITSSVGADAGAVAWMLVEPGTVGL